MTEPGFVQFTDLASERLGGKVLLCSDDFFAEKENLTKPGRGIFIPDKYTDRGKWMERSFGTSRSSGSTRSSENRSSGESPTTPRDRHYGNTVGTIPRHDSGSTHSTELGKLRGLKVHIVKPQGKLTIKVPKGVSGELRDALGRAIHELLRVKGYLYDPNDLVHSVGVHEVKAFKTLHGTRYEVQYKITPRLEKEAKTYVASSIKNLLAQCNFIGLMEAQFIHLLDPKNDDLVRGLST